MNLTTYDYIDSNRRKTFWLIFLFPTSFLLLLFVMMYIFINSSPEMQIKDIPVIVQIFKYYWGFFVFAILLAIVWIIVSYYQGSQIVLNMVDAEKAGSTNLMYKDIQRILENVSITAGIPVPELYILTMESGLNAFAVGTNKNNSAVVLTQGLIDVLDSSELEAVIAHEVAHIVHQDTRLMMCVTLLIGFFTFFGSFILGGRRSSFNGRNTSRVNAGTKAAGRTAGILMVLGLAMYIYGYFFAPFIKLAISRTREFEADAKSALLTRNPQALISALKKISNRPVVSRFEDNEIMSPMCIVSPLTIKISFFDTLANLSSTHPPLKDRIKALEVMDGKIAEK